MPCLLRFLKYIAIVALLISLPYSTPAAELRPLVLVPVSEVPTIQSEIFQAICNYLTEELKRPVHLVFTKSYSDLQDRFGEGKIDIVFGGPYNYILAKEKYGARALVIRKLEGSTEYRSYIFVREDSNINTLHDLKGKRFSFTDEISTSGYLLPRIMMFEEGIHDPNTFFSEVKFKRTYQDVLESVLLREVDGAAIASFQFEGFGLRNRSLKIIKKSRFLKLGPVFANPLTLSQSEMDEIKNAFLAIGKTQRTESLAKILQTHFLSAEDMDYNWVNEYRKVLSYLPPINPVPAEWKLPDASLIVDSSVDARIKVILIFVITIVFVIALWKSRKRLFQGLGGRILISFLSLILLVVSIIGGLFYFKEKEILTTNAQRTGQLFAYGVMLATRDAILQGDKTFLSRYVRSLIQQRQMELTFIEIHGKEGVLRVLLASASQSSISENLSLDISIPVMLREEKQGEIKIGFSQEKTKKALLDTLLNILLIGITTSTIAAIVAIGLTRRITKPLAALTNHTHRIAAGDLEQMVKVVSDDEIGLLAKAFNKMAEELKETTTRLYRHQKLMDIGLLLAEINHRLRNTISGINNYARLLQKKLPSISTKDNEMTRVSGKRLQIDAASDISIRDIRYYVDRIREGTEHIDALLKRLSVPSSLAMNIAPVSLKKVMEGTCKKIRSEAEDQGIKLITRYDEGIPTVMGDKERLNDVFENLLLNAMDAVIKNTNGARFITATVRKENGYVVSDIEDTGGGIPNENLHRIFDPFFSTKENGGGGGLGLYITHAIIERHGGQIYVTSEIGKGSHFTVSLPASGE